MVKAKAEVMKDLAKVRRRKITIQRKEKTQNELGDPVEAWVEWRTAWAERGSLWGSEYYAAMAVNEEKTVVFALRHVAFLDELNVETHRLVYDSSIYDIKHIDYLKDDGMWVKIKALGRDS